MAFAGLSVAGLQSMYLVLLSFDVETQYGIFDVQTIPHTEIDIRWQRVVVLVGALCGSLSVGLAGLADSRWKNLPARWLELAILAWTFFIFACGMLQNPKYLSSLNGLEVRRVVSGDAADAHIVMLLYMLALVNCLHAFQLRFCIVIIFDIAIPGVALLICYATSFERVHLGMFFISLSAICTGAYGKRETELDQRALFTRAISEKCLRFAAEHKLEAEVSTKAINQMSPPSHAETNLSSELFRRFEVNPQPSNDAMRCLARLGCKEHWLIDLNEVQVLRHGLLGYGAYGMVLPAVHHGTPVVLKASRRSDSSVSLQDLRSVAQELRVFRRLRHPNIALFYGACVHLESPELLVVMEYIAGECLDMYVMGRRASAEELDPWRAGLAHDISCALCYLHSQRPQIVHGDIKGSNVIVENIDWCPRAKLIDFGLSRVMSKKRRRPLGGTLAWMAPEVVLDTGCAPAASADVFSFGRLIYMIITSTAPCKGLVASDFHRAAAEQRPLQLDWSCVGASSVVEQWQQLSAECQHMDPDGRPAMSTCQPRVEALMVLMFCGGEAGESADAVTRRLNAEYVDVGRGIQDARSRLAECDQMPLSAVRAVGASLMHPRLRLEASPRAQFMSAGADTGSVQVAVSFGLDRSHLDFSASSHPSETTSI